MADLIRITSRKPETICERDRGQLLLATALILATLLVVMALVLNSVIFTENFATKGDSARDTQDALHYRTSAVTELDRAIVDANRNDTSYKTLNTALKDEVGTWSTLAALHEAENGRDASTTITNVTNGTRIIQSNFSRSLTNVSGATQWELASDASGVRSFEMNISEPSLVQPTNTSTSNDLKAADVFNIEFTESTGDVWRIFVYSNNSDVILRVEEPDGTLRAECSVAAGSNDAALIGVTAGTLNGTQCGPLMFIDALENPIRIGFESGQNAEGTYTLVVAQLEATVDDGDFSVGDTGPSPYTTEAIYGATAGLQYNSPIVQYQTSISVVPEETNDG